MDGKPVQAPALLAGVVRNFLGSRLERELLAQAFALAWGEPVTMEDERERGAAANLDRAAQRKGA
jgi:hypothetical protein